MRTASKRTPAITRPSNWTAAPPTELTGSSTANPANDPCPALAPPARPLPKRSSREHGREVSAADRGRPWRAHGRDQRRGGRGGCQARGCQQRDRPVVARARDAEVQDVYPAVAVEVVGVGRGDGRNGLPRPHLAQVRRIHVERGGRVQAAGFPHKVAEVEDVVGGEVGPGVRLHRHLEPAVAHGLPQVGGILRVVVAPDDRRAVAPGRDDAGGDGKWRGARRPRGGVGGRAGAEREVGGAEQRGARDVDKVHHYAVDPARVAGDVQEAGGAAWKQGHLVGGDGGVVGRARQDAVAVEGAAVVEDPPRRDGGGGGPRGGGGGGGDPPRNPRP